MKLLAVVVALWAPSPSPSCALPPPTFPVAVAGRIAAAPASDTTLTGLYAEGVDFDEFLDAVDPQARPEVWRSNFGRGVADDELLARARAIPGEWRIVAVALDACSDSVHTLPYIAALAAALPRVELRVVHPDAGRPVMEAHRTPDDRAATPTFVVLDHRGEEVGCWIERPTPLQAFMLNPEDGRERMEKFRMKMAWYEADAGWTTLQEFVEVLEGAASGTPVCRRPVDADGTYPVAGSEGRPVGGGSLR